MRQKRQNVNSNWEWKDSESPNSRFIKQKKTNPLGKRKKGKKRKSAFTKRPDDKFYSAWSWRKLRFEVLKKYGAVCMLCNSTENIVVDHILPRKKFPKLAMDINNLQVLCRNCNMGKSDDDYTDFRPDLDEINKELDMEHLANVVKLFE